MGNQERYYDLKNAIALCYNLNGKKCIKCKYNTSCKEYLEFKVLEEERLKNIKSTFIKREEK